jgi:hypothetical protein
MYHPDIHFSGILRSAPGGAESISGAAALIRDGYVLVLILIARIQIDLTDTAGFDGVHDLTMARSGGASIPLGVE